MYILVYLIHNVFIVFAVARFTGVFFERRRTPLYIAVISYLLFFTLSSVAYLRFGILAINMIITLVTFFLITLNYEAPMVKRLFAVFVFFITLAIVETITIFMHNTATFSVWYGVEYVGIFSTLSSGLLYFFIASVLRNFKNIRRRTFNLPKYWISVLIIPALSWLLLYLVLISYLGQVITVIFIAVVVVINLLMLYLHDILSATFEDKLQLALHAQEKEYYFTQCQLMQESVENIKSIRHDMKFHLATARDFTANNQTDKATEYLSSLLGNIENNEIYSNTRNIAFDSIINFKLNNTKQEDIKTDIRMLIPPSLNIEAADIVTIMGNLLDNALDAVAGADEKIIKLDVEYSNESLFIRVENTFDGVVKYENRQGDEKKRIVTRKNGSNHGRGLGNIRKAAEKYDGLLDIEHRGNVFSAGVFLYISPNDCKIT